MIMRLCWQVLTLALVLQGCASARPVSWFHASGQTDEPALALAAAQCRADAQLAASQVRRDPQPPRIVVQQQVTLEKEPVDKRVDFSWIGETGEALATKRMRSDVYDASMEGCMARRGYIKRG